MATNSLEQQALDRVARMYAGYDRRRPSGSTPPAQPAPRQAEPPRPEPPVSDQRDTPQPPAPPQPPGHASGLLGALMEDKEQSLIMLLLVILMKDGADMDAVLALMYLLI